MKPVGLSELVPGVRVVVIQADDSAFVAALSPDGKTWEIEFPEPLVTSNPDCFEGIGCDPKVQPDDQAFLLPVRLVQKAVPRQSEEAG